MTPRSAQAGTRPTVTPVNSYRKSSAMLAKQQAREHEVVTVAIAVLIRRGWNDFTMDEVIASSPLSRGTLYKHFRSREDLGIAVAVELLTQHLKFVERVANFPGGTRERYIALVGAFRLYSLLNPELSTCLYSLYNPEIRSKASPDWQKRFELTFQEIMRQPLSLIHDGFSAKDITGDKSVTAERISCGVWSALFGFGQLVNMGVPLSNSIMEDGLGFQDELIDCVLDGYGWRPLSSTFDYKETLHRLISDYYPEESVLFRQKLKPRTLE